MFEQISLSQLDFIIVLVFIFLITKTTEFLSNSKKMAAQRYKDSNISNNKECVNYLNELKSMPLTSVYAGATSLVTGLIMYTFLSLLNVKEKHLITLLVTLTSFTASYKYHGCFMYREICGAGFCK